MNVKQLDDPRWSLPTLPFYERESLKHHSVKLSPNNCFLIRVSFPQFSFIVVMQEKTKLWFCSLIVLSRQWDNYSLRKVIQMGIVGVQQRGGSASFQCAVTLIRLIQFSWCIVFSIILSSHLSIQTFTVYRWNYGIASFSLCSCSGSPDPTMFMGQLTYIQGGSVLETQIYKLGGQMAS